MLMLSKKIIVVTGGAGVLGRHFCSEIVKHGGVVVVADCDEYSVAKVVNELNKIRSDSGVAANLDITNFQSVENLILNLHENFGRIDAVVNNAYPRNKNYGRKLEDVTYEDFCDNVGAHLGGYFLVAQRFGLYFRDHAGGNIINISSIYGSIAPRFEIYSDTSMTMPVEYSAIKSAVIQLTRYFAQYFKGTGIRVNCLSPGGILSAQPASFLDGYKGYCASKGMLLPSDVVGSLLFLLSDQSQFMNGQNLIVDDGFSL
jgi:NAD(P)-dependent dehydrogenase (short-subunit alcohol dehydrogenase family)